MISTTPPPFRTQTFGVVSGLGEAPMLLRILCEELSKLTSRIVIPQVLRSYPDLMQRITRGTVHIAWVPPLLANELWSATVAAIALCSVRGGKSSYHSVVFAPRNTAVRTLADLAGRHMAWVDRSSAAGYVIPRLRIAAAGHDPGALFGRETFHENHAQMARAVFSGEADAGATFAVFDPRTGRLVRAGWEEAGAPLDSGRLLTTAGPIPSDGIVLSAKIPPPLAAEMTAALAQLPRRSPHALRALLGVEGFVAPDTAHFDELRSLVEGARPRAERG